MDAHLFMDFVSESSLPNDGPPNARRPAVYRQSLWFNTAHESFPPRYFEDYLSIRGWDQELLQQGRWCAAHPDNASKPAVDVVYDAIDILQSWMTVGFLEGVFQSREWLAPYIQPPGEAHVRQLQQLLPTLSL